MMNLKHYIMLENTILCLQYAEPRIYGGFIEIVGNIYDSPEIFERKRNKRARGQKTRSSNYAPAKLQDQASNAERLLYLTIHFIRMSMILKFKKGAAE